MHIPRGPTLRLLVVIGAAAALLGGPADADPGPSNAKLNKKIDNVVFKDAAGKVTSLHDLKDKKAVVVVFLSFECPVSNNYSVTLADLAKNYGERGVAFFGVCPCDDDPATIAKQARDFALPFPVCKDDKLAIADAFKADITPEAFVLDQHFILRYRGRIDDGYANRLKKKAVIGRHDLKVALDEVLAGKPVSQPVTQALGCTIVRESVVKKPTGKVTYYKDVLPILQNNCQSCHRPGEVGPFSLLTYHQAVNWASDIKEYTQSRKMPPWKPVAGPAFRDDRSMSPQDIATLAAWVDGGTPEGDPKDAPPPRTFVDGWQLGKPDLVLTVPEDFTLGPSGRDLFRCFVLPTNLEEDKFVTAVEVRPGNRRVVHHTLHFVDTPREFGDKMIYMARDLEQKAKANRKPTDQDYGPGYSVAMGIGFFPRGGLGGWAPGQVPRHLPENTGYFLPKGSDVVVQVHYHRNGRVEKDRLAIGLYFSKKPLEKRYSTVIFRANFFFIPSGAERYRVTGSTWIDQDCELRSIMPHMHQLGKEVKVTMTPPGGKPQTLIEIRDWDYNWQETYFLKEPIAVKQGTRFDVEAVYDNSARNPNNPNNPPKIVRFGEQTEDEMCFIFLGATSDKPGRIRQSKGPPGKAEK